MTFVQDPSPQTPSRTQRSLVDWLDIGFAILVILWTAEALARVPAPAAVTALAYAYFVPRLALAAPRLLPALVRCWPVLLYPLICTVSVLWSLVPVVTLVASIQLWFTVLVGIFLGQRFGIAGLAGLVLCALGVSVVASAANLTGALQPVYGYEGGFLGIYTNKNALGQRGALLLLTLLLFAAIGARRVLWALAALGTVVVLILSQSVTALLVGFLWGGAFVLLTMRPGRGVAVVVLATLGVMTLAAIWVLDLNPVQDGLAALGKTPTLTGRTLLWDIALQKARDFPMLGMGFMAYWQAPAFAEEVRTITQLYGGTVGAFHNFLLEVLTMLGPLGVVAMLILVGWSGVALWRLPPGPLRLWAGLSFALLVGLSLLGSSLYRAHEMSLLLVVALGAAAASERGGGSAGRAARTR